MARLIYSAITSLDGYAEDEQGRFDWARPEEEVHGGRRALPDDVRVRLELLDQRRFGGGVCISATGSTEKRPQALATAGCDSTSA